MSRSAPEWIAKSDDERIPPRVKLRIFERDGGRCHISGRLIRSGEAWDADHVIALCNGGQHRETNLAPALVDRHREKTKSDVAEKSNVYRKRSKHVGLRAQKKKIQSRGFQKAAPQRTASRQIERKSEQ